jgi:phage shock protein A
MQAAKAQEQLQSQVSSLNTSSSMAAFERMEEKVLEAEARSQAAGELAGVDLESQFAMLESGSDVEDELAAMKAQMIPPPDRQTMLPPTPSPNADVDAELEQLRRELGQ